MATRVERETFMPDRRGYTRFRLNDHEVNGKMVLANEVKIVDISDGGISLKVDKRLNLGSSYTLKLEGSKTVSLKGIVVWCSLSATRNSSRGEVVPIYSAGMRFKDMSQERMAELHEFIQNHKIEAVRVMEDGKPDARLNIRFHVDDPEKTVLLCPDSYTVHTISLGGMLIECAQDLEIDSRIPMEMFVHDDKHLKFVGRVASSRAEGGNGQKQYRIGIEFLNLTEKDMEVLASFIGHSDRIEPETKDRTGTNVSPSSHDDTAIIPKEFTYKVEYLHKWHATMGYYKLLGIHEYATDEQIRQAFLQRAEELHPGKFPDAPEDLKSKLHELFAYLNLAHATLLDPIKRRTYDKRPISRIRR